MTLWKKQCTYTVKIYKDICKDISHYKVIYYHGKRPIREVYFCDKQIISCINELKKFLFKC